MTSDRLNIDRTSDFRITQSTATLLIGNRLILARIAWFSIFIFTAIICLAGIKPSIESYIATSRSLKPMLDQFRLSENFYVVYQLIISAGLLLIFTAVALLIFWRKSNDLVAILFSIAIFTIGARNTDFPLYVRDLTHTFSPGALAFMTFSVIGYIVAYSLVGVMPNGRCIPSWVRYAIILWIPLMVVAHFLALITRTNAQIYEPLIPIVVIFAFAGLYAQVVRYRRTIDVLQRQQMKWVIFGFCVALSGVIIYRLGNSILPFFIKTPETIFLINFFTRPISAVALTAVPVSLAFSMLRYRLFDIDLIIGRSLVFGGLTVLLGAVFFVLIVILQRFVQPVIAIGVSAISIELLLHPTRRRLQRLVDRYFFKLDHNAKAPVPTPDEQLNDKQLGAYILQESLGQGGMAEVYKGHHTSLKRSVAVKVMYAERAEDSSFRQRFENEARTAAALRHPNIIQVYDFGEMQGIYYMVMEYIAGQNLSQYINQQGKLTPDKAHPIITDIAAALDYAHQQHVIHRDVKPSNVMLQPVHAKRGDGDSFRAILTDFGIARITLEKSDITQTGSVGTIDYMSPEQIISSEVDSRSDIYSLGVMAYQMLTGELPFKAGNVGAAVLARLNQEPRNPCEANPDLPVTIAKALLRALSKSPDQRFQTAGEFAKALK